MEHVRKRFLAKTKRVGACLEWTGYRDLAGYGNFSIAGKTFYSHRAAWALFRGKTPEGASVLHKCDNRACVDLEHLYLGDQKQNVKDATDRGRSRQYKLKTRTHCPVGHEFSPENTYLFGGGRYCKSCRSAYSRAYYPTRKKNDAARKQDR